MVSKVAHHEGSPQFNDLILKKVAREKIDVFFVLARKVVKLYHRMEQYRSKRGRSREEEIWAEIIHQFESSSLAVVRSALITSNSEMLLRQDMPLSITSRLLEVLVVRNRPFFHSFEFKIFSKFQM